MIENTERTSSIINWTQDRIDWRFSLVEFVYMKTQTIPLPKPSKALDKLPYRL